MGYNISDVGGQAIDGVDVWTATLDINDPNVTTVSGDFDVVAIFGGANLGEATDGYVFSALSNPSFGTLSSNDVDGTYTFTPDWGAILSASTGPGDNQLVSFTVTGTSGADSDTDTVQITLVVCVVRGTLIETETGPMPVEEITRGTQVITLDGGLQPVRWIGSRKMTRAELSTDFEKRPIVFAADALGKGVPDRRLSVSPQHRMLLSGWQAELLFGEDQVLVPAKGLLNDHSITRDNSLEPVEYFHLLFDDHQIIFAENTATESFHPGAYTMSELDDAARTELFELMPELTVETGYGDTARTALREWEGKLLSRSIAESEHA